MKRQEGSPVGQFEAPYVPTIEDDPGRYNNWVYGLEEVSSHTGLAQETVAGDMIYSAQHHGYRSADDVLWIRRKFVQLRSDEMRGEVCTEGSTETSHLQNAEI